MTLKIGDNPYPAGEYARQVLCFRGRRRLSEPAEAFEALAYISWCESQQTGDDWADCIWRAARRELRNWLRTSSLDARKPESGETYGSQIVAREDRDGSIEWVQSLLKGRDADLIARYYESGQTVSEIAHDWKDAAGAVSARLQRIHRQLWETMS